MKITVAIVCIAMFVASLWISNTVRFPQAVTASIELYSSVETEDGKLSSGFDTFRQDVLIGLEGLWSVLFAGGVTGLAYALKAVRYVVNLVDNYLDSRIKEPEGPVVTQQEASFEQILIDAAYEKDPEALEFAANRLSGNGKKWCMVAKAGGE